MIAPVSGTSFAAAALGLLAEVAEASSDARDAAASLLADVVMGGGLVHAFGTGHSQAAALELAGRAGGLIPTNCVGLADLVIYGGRPPSALDDPLLERRAGVAAEVFALADIRSGDVVVILSNSGVNATVLEMAALVKQAGVPLIAITSIAHSSAVRPALGDRRLYEMADVTLDNGAPYGDAILQVDEDTTACGVSSLTTALLVQMTVADAIAKLSERGVSAPVYQSANTPGGHQRNLVLEAGYEGRLRRIAH